MRAIAVLIIVLVVVLAVVGPQALYTVDETQAAIVTRFGEPIGEHVEPGLYFKTPFIDKVTYFDRRSTLFDAAPDSFLTEDKKRLIIDAYAIGRVTDPLVFFKSVRTAQRAETRGKDIIVSDLRQEIANDLQVDVIKENREAIMNRVKVVVGPKLLEFGVTTVDVRVKRADFPIQIANSIYARMDAERKRIANAERAEGAKKDLEIRAGVNRQATIIRSEAQQEADIIRGQGNAEAVRIFAEALNQDPEFYLFQRSLEAYRKFLTQNATVVLPADSDLFRFLQSPGITPGSESDGPGAAAPGSQGSQIEVAARQHLSVKLGVDPSALVMTRQATTMDWSDSSLGCPEQGMSYAQVIVPGHSLAFEYQGTISEVHSNSDGSQVVSC